MNQRKQLAATGTSVVTLGTLVGGTLAPEQTNAHTPQDISYTAKSVSQSNAHDITSYNALRTMLDAPLREHASVSVETLKATLLKTPDLEALGDVVEDNNIAIAETVESGYPGTHDEFLGLWRAHIGYYKDYLRATVRDDESAKEQAKDNLTKFAEELSMLLADASPQLDPDEMEESLSIHADQVTTIIDDMADEEYDDAYATSHEAYEHMGVLADLLARNAHHQHETARQL